MRGEEEEAEIGAFQSKAQIAGDTLPPAFKGYGVKDTVEEA